MKRPTRLVGTLLDLITWGRVLKPRKRYAYRVIPPETKRKLNLISFKVIRMLFVVVAEFFVCWTPLHVLNTWCLFDAERVYGYVGSTGIALVQLLAFIGSCCNPITYCFMNRKFRQAFLGVFSCYRYERFNSNIEVKCHRFVLEFVAVVFVWILKWLICNLGVVCNVVVSIKYYRITRMCLATILLYMWGELVPLVDPVSIIF